MSFTPRSVCRLWLCAAGMFFAAPSLPAAEPEAGGARERPEPIVVFGLRPSPDNAASVQEALAALDREVELLEAANERRKGGVKAANQERIDSIKAARAKLAAQFSLDVWKSTLREVFNAMEVDRVAEAGLDDVSLWNLSQNEEFTNPGKATVMFNCIPCHLPDLRGKGATGEAFAPDLTDHWWIHGGRPSEVLYFITHGAPMKGMPGWGALIGPKKVAEAAAYVLSHHKEGEPIYKQEKNEPVSNLSE